MFRHVFFERWVEGGVARGSAEYCSAMQVFCNCDQDLWILFVKEHTFSIFTDLQPANSLIYDLLYKYFTTILTKGIEQLF